MDPHLTWNLYRDVTQLFDYPFMVNAYRAGTIVAVTAAIIAAHLNEPWEVVDNLVLEGVLALAEAG